MTKVKCSEIICKGNVEGNFITVPAGIYDYLELGLISTKDLTIYIKLLDLYNQDYGYAFPTISQLRRMSGIKSKTTVDKCLDKLENVGLIKRGKAKKGNNVYVVYKPLKKSELYPFL
jgi:predicted transcriptional regulator